MVSALGGSRYQIGGPAAAFIGLVAGSAATLGISGLLLAVMMSGAMLVLLGLSRLGGLVRQLPHAVTVGFTAAIAITLIASQLKDLGGLTLSHDPVAFIPKLVALTAALPTVKAVALALGLAVAAAIALLRRLRPDWPGMLLALAAASLIGMLPGVAVETIGGRFGDIPSALPIPVWPPLTLPLLVNVFPTAVAFTLLGAIESLLSAKVADGMTGRRHRANMELVAQGAANVASALFGGICVTGTIARTATNIRAGARSPVAGLLHAVFLLTVLVVAAPAIRYVPLTALAGVLLVVAWNMAERAELWRLLRQPRTALVLAVTVGVTLTWSLVAGIVAGCLLAAGFAALRHPLTPESHADMPPR